MAPRRWSWASPRPRPPRPGTTTAAPASPMEVSGAGGETTTGSSATEPCSISTTRGGYSRWRLAGSPRLWRSWLPATEAVRCSPMAHSGAGDTASTTRSGSPRIRRHPGDLGRARGRHGGIPCLCPLVRRDSPLLGRQRHGQLGYDSPPSSVTPVATHGIFDASAVGVQDKTTPARSGSTARCSAGEAALWVDSEDRSVFAPPFRSRSAESRPPCPWESRRPRLRCSLRRERSMLGNQRQRALGNGTNESSATPVTVSGISSAIAVSAGSSHSCALLSDATLWCWGSNGQGRLGDGTTDGSRTPVTGQRDLLRRRRERRRHAHLCRPVGWRRHLLGEQRRQGSWAMEHTKTPPRRSRSLGYPTRSPSLPGTITPALSSRTGPPAAGATAAGSAGDGTTETSPFPVAVTGMLAAAGVTAGKDHSCALLSDGAIQCWGFGGQLGTILTDLLLRHSRPAQRDRVHLRCRWLRRHLRHPDDRGHRVLGERRQREARQWKRRQLPHHPDPSDRDLDSRRRGPWSKAHLCCSLRR